MLRGEEAAFQLFFDAYFPRLYRFALSLTRHQEDVAEEIVQITLCKAISALQNSRNMRFSRNAQHWEWIDRQPSVSDREAPVPAEEKSDKRTLS